MSAARASFTAPAEVLEQLDARAAELDVKRPEVIRIALERYLEQLAEPEPGDVADRAEILRLLTAEARDGNVRAQLELLKLVKDPLDEKMDEPDSAGADDDDFARLEAEDELAARRARG